MKRLSASLLFLSGFMLLAYGCGEDNDRKEEPEMVLIPAGEFSMGDHHGVGTDDERPVHTVYIDAFYIDKYEVTNAQYRRFVEATGYREPWGFGYVDYVSGDWRDGVEPWLDERFNRDDQPVVCVSWEDASAYCEWAGKRLPTEAEWEKAARGGLVGAKYVWGNDWDPANRVGNFADETAKRTFPNWYIIRNYDDGYVYPAPVGSFDPNGYGLHDMAGNVWEWCADLYDPDYYAKSSKQNPAGSGSGSWHVVRGGSWNNVLRKLRVANRLHDLPATPVVTVGFRCAR